MQLSETVKLYPTEYQIELTRNTMSEYISTVNNIVSDYTNKDNGNIESVKEIKNIKSIVTTIIFVFPASINKRL